MAEANDLYESLYQNLIDSGCDTQTTERCMLYMKEGKVSDMLPILIWHKAALPASLHTGQKQIDCLDFLICKLKKLS